MKIWDILLSSVYLGLCLNHEFLIVHPNLHSKNVLGPVNKKTR